MEMLLFLLSWVQKKNSLNDYVLHVFATDAFDLDLLLSAFVRAMSESRARGSSIVVAFRTTLFT